MNAETREVLLELSDVLLDMCRLIECYSIPLGDVPLRLLDIKKKLEKEAEQ